MGNQELFDRTINDWINKDGAKMAARRLGRITLNPTIEKIAAAIPDMPKMSFEAQHAIEALIAFQAEDMLSKQKSQYLSAMLKIQEEIVKGMVDGTLLK